MAPVRVRLAKKIDEADGTMSFHFAKPEGFEFRAGQYADYTLVDPPETDAEGNTRGFTFSSAPFEHHLACTTRIRDSAFKRVLAALPIDTELELDGPYGAFTLPRNAARPVVFLTGGIGITPVRSMVLQAHHDHTPHRITVLYSNRRPEDAAYLEELTRLSESSPNITVVPTMTHPEQSAMDWSGHTGRIDAAMLSEFVPDPQAPLWFLCGPAAMVKAMRTLLDGAGVDDDDLRTEEFTGY